MILDMEFDRINLLANTTTPWTAPEGTSYIEFRNAGDRDVAIAKTAANIAAGIWRTIVANGGEWFFPQGPKLKLVSATARTFNLRSAHAARIEVVCYIE